MRMPSGISAGGCQFSSKISDQLGKLLPALFAEGFGLLPNLIESRGPSGLHFRFALGDLAVFFRLLPGEFAGQPISLGLKELVNPREFLLMPTIRSGACAVVVFVRGFERCGALGFDLIEPAFSLRLSMRSVFHRVRG